MANDTPPPQSPAGTADEGSTRHRRLQPLVWILLSVLALVVAVGIVSRPNAERPLRTVAAVGLETSTTTSTTEAPTTTAVDLSTTPTTAKAPTTSVPATSTTTTTSPVLSCDDADIAVKVETDKPAYATGEMVVITVLATNISGKDCQPGGGANVRILRADGTVVYRVPASVASWPDGGARHSAGETWRDTDHRWDQRCHADDCVLLQQQPPDDYRIEAQWHRYGSASTTIHTS